MAEPLAMLTPFIPSPQLEEIERDLDKATAYLGLTRDADSTLVLLRLILKVQELEVEFRGREWGLSNAMTEEHAIMAEYGAEYSE